MTEKYLEVYTVYGRPQAEMLQIYLNSYEIPCILEQESAGVSYGLSVGPLGEVTILVPASMAERAQQLLDELKNQNPEDIDLDDENKTDFKD